MPATPAPGLVGPAWLQDRPGPDPVPTPAPPPGPAPPAPGGLAAVPEAWLPIGVTRGYATSPYGADYFRTERRAGYVRMDPDHALTPALEATDLGGGRVRLFVDMPWPIPNIKLTGSMERRDGQVFFQEENGNRTAEMHQRWDGILVITIHQPGEEDLRLTYQNLGPAPAGFWPRGCPGWNLAGA